MRRNSLTNVIMEENNSAYVSGAITLSYYGITDASAPPINTFSSTITSFSADSRATIGIIENSKMIDSSGNLYLKRDFEIEQEVIDFIEGKKELKDTIEKIIRKIYALISSENKLSRVVIGVNKSENKIEVSVYLSDKTIGSLIDLNDRVNSIIFEEVQKLNDTEERYKLLNLFGVKLFDVKNGIKL